MFDCLSHQDDQSNRVLGPLISSISRCCVERRKVTGSPPQPPTSFQFLVNTRTLDTHTHRPVGSSNTNWTSEYKQHLSIWMLAWSAWDCDNSQTTDTRDPASHCWVVVTVSQLPGQILHLFVSTFPRALTDCWVTEINYSELPWNINKFVLIESPVQTSLSVSSPTSRWTTLS